MSQYIAFNDGEPVKLDVIPAAILHHKFRDEDGETQSRRLQPITIEGKTYLYAYEGKDKPADHKIIAEIIRLNLEPYK